MKKIFWSIFGYMRTPPDEACPSHIWRGGRGQPAHQLSNATHLVPATKLSSWDKSQFAQCAGRGSK